MLIVVTMITDSSSIQIYKLRNKKASARAALRVIANYSTHSPDNSRLVLEAAEQEEVLEELREENTEVSKYVGRPEISQ